MISQGQLQQDELDRDHQRLLGHDEPATILPLNSLMYPLHLMSGYFSPFHLQIELIRHEVPLKAGVVEGPRVWSNSENMLALQ